MYSLTGTSNLCHNYFTKEVGEFTEHLSSSMVVNPWWTGVQFCPGDFHCDSCLNLAFVTSSKEGPLQNGVNHCLHGFVVDKNSILLSSCSLVCVALFRQCKV